MGCVRVWSREGTPLGIKLFSNRFYLSLLVVNPPLSSSPAIPGAVNFCPFQDSGGEMGWFLVFSTAALDFNFPRF